MSHTFELGSSARDIVSGWAGTITARYEYLNGCERYEISGKDKDGKPEAYVFDAQQVEVTKAPDAKLTRKPEPARVGGPRGSAPVSR